MEKVNGDSTASRLVADALSLAYDDRMIVDGLSLEVPTGLITVIVGANACGKSTLLRGLARLMKPKGGVVLLDGEPIARAATREVATKLGILPQQPIAPDGLSVHDLVSRGRHPHQRWFRQWSPEDEAAVVWALEQTDLTELGRVRWTSSPAVNANGHGSRWRSRRARPSSCSMSRRRSSTLPTSAR